MESGRCWLCRDALLSLQDLRAAQGGELRSSSRVQEPSSTARREAAAACASILRGPAASSRRCPQSKRSVDGVRPSALTTRLSTNVDALFDRIEREQGRLDILVNNVNADTSFAQKPFWEYEPATVKRIVETAIFAHILNARRAARLMVKQTSGMIVEVTDGDGWNYRGEFGYDLTKTTAIRLAMTFAAELRPHGVAAVAVTPGFIRSEAVLESLGVAEENWRDAIDRRPEFAESESTHYVGRVISALAADPLMMQKTGRVFTSVDLGREYDVDDIDGRRPDVWKFIREKMPQFVWKKIDDTFYSYFNVDFDAFATEMRREP